VREVIERARYRLGERDQGTILFLDEIHRFSKAQQDALLPAVEDGTLTLIGATTENPFFEVNPPLRSRSTLFRLEPLDADAIDRRCSVAGSRPRGPTADDEAIELLVDRAAGDGRQVLTSLEVACALAHPGRRARPRRGRPRHERAALRP
jgi:putative ATPase